ACIAAPAATAETASRLALDVAMYDQQGCVSPHIAFVERGGPLSPAAFARAVADALADLQERMPRGRLTLEEAAALRGARDEAEFTADACFLSPGDLSWAVVHHEQPDFRPSPLGRFLYTYAVDRLDEVVALAAPHAPLLQTVAFAGPDADRLALAGALGRLGVSRVAPVGRVQEPHPLWRHDGRPTAGDLVRWVDIEP
ncbi:acyl-CoA reductase, partial [Symbiobacterium terraclitae]